jgi:prefoldin beta subunit
MKLEKQTEEKIKRLQQYEQNMQTFALQKQQFQSQLIEVDSALAELEKVDVAYKIVGNIMVKSDKQNLQGDLQQKKDMVSLRIRAMEKQEDALRDKSKQLQKEVLGEIKNEEK